MNDSASRVGHGAPLTVCLDYRPELGGLTRGVRDLADAVGGHVVSLDSLPRSASAAEAPAPAAGLTRMPVSDWALFSPLGRLPPRLERMLDDEIARAPLVIVHSLYRAHLPSIARLCRLRHVPYWVVAHGMLDPWVLARRRAAKRLWLRLHGQSCLREAATVLFSTASEREKARIAYGGSNVAVIPWPIDIPGTDGRPAARAAVRNGLGIGPERNVLLWLGRYDSLKRPVTIVEAFARGAPRDWVLIMAGFPGDTPRNRVETAADRFAPGRVHVLGPATGADKSRLLLGADAFVSLSWRENYGYAVAEAMAAGLPIVIAPDHDLLADGAFLHFGSRCADHSVASAIAAVAGLCGQKAALRMAGGDRAREWATRSLTRDLFQNNVERLLGATSTALGRQVELTPVNHHPT